jgi:hypothetical protein
MKRLLPLVLVVLCALPARADFDFLGYGLQLELSPLLAPENAAQSLPHHDASYINDRLLWIRQADPIGIVVDAQFFGLSQLIFAGACALEGTPCTGAEQSYTGGGYRRVASLDVALTLDYDNLHPGIGLTTDLVGTPTVGGAREEVLGIGGDFILGLSMLGPVYLQAGLGAQPAFRYSDMELVGVRGAGEITAVIAIPWVAVYGTAGYQALIPMEPSFELAHGPYVELGLMMSVGTIFDALGLGWRAAAGVGKGIGGVVGGGDKDK